MKVNTVIFDLDGTILDSLEDLTDSVNIMLKGESYPLREKREVREFIGEGYRKLIERALPPSSSAAEVDRCTELFQKIYEKNMANKTKPYDGIVDLLRQLKSLEIKIGVVSNKMDGATKEACKHYFDGHIDVAIGDSPLRKKKPAPDNVHEVMRLLEAEKDRTIFVGDSNVDVQTAKNAGLVCVGVTWGFRSREVLMAEGADFIIDEPSMLLEIIK